MSSYNLRKIALHLGVSIAVFLFSCGLVGYEAVVTETMFKYQIGLHPVPSFFLVEFVEKILGVSYFQAMFIVEFIGILGMIAGITGIVYVIKGILIRKERHLVVIE